MTDLDKTIAEALPRPTGRCHRCNDLGLRSTVRQVPVPNVHYSAPDVYFDEEGRWHYHSQGSGRVGYRCSQGHDWTETNPHPCSAKGCDVGHEEPEVKYKEGGAG